MVLLVDRNCSTVERRMVESWVCVFDDDVFCPSSKVAKDERVASVCLDCNHSTRFAVDDDVRSGEVVSGSGFALVGHGEITNGACGNWAKRNFGCLNVEEHGVSFDRHGNMVNHSGKIYVRPVRMSCNKPSCPICVNRWRIRAAKRMEGRLLEASKTYGLVEHIVVSPPRREYGCNVDDWRGRAEDIARSRGVIGASVIYHEYRWSELRCSYYYSPHFHMLGFVGRGYRCRECEKFDFRSMRVCGDCHGFEGLTRRLNVNDGWIVKVCDKREKLFGSDKPNVYGTAKYELGHASYKVDAKRANVVCWWGVVAYRKMKYVPVKEPCLCGDCGRELVEVQYVGDDVEVLGLFGSRSSAGAEHLWLDLCRDGVPVWVEVNSGEHRSRRWRKGDPF